MSSLTTFSAGCAVPGSTAVPARRSLLKRAFDRLIESRMRKAEEVLRQQGHLIPRDLERAGWRITERSEDSLPFIR